MVHAENSQIDHAWLTGLRHDLHWLYGVEATPDEMLRNEDHTALIDYWQCSSSHLEPMETPAPSCWETPSLSGSDDD